MALTNQDLSPGIDFTALATADGSDHDALVTLTTPKSDTNGDGKGLTLRTKDNPVGTPIVPDAATYTKWKRYLWIRIFGDAATTPIIYAWDDSLSSDPVFLKWREVSADVAGILNDVATANTNANEALQKAIDAYNLAGVANKSAGDAIIVANAADGVADEAKAAAGIADGKAQNAQQTADAAYLLANNNKVRKYDSGVIPLPDNHGTGYDWTNVILNNVDHSLLGIPTSAQVFLHCIVTDTSNVYGWEANIGTAGEIFPIENFYESNRGPEEMPFELKFTDSKIYLRGLYSTSNVGQTTIGRYIVAPSNTQSAYFGLDVAKWGVRVVLTRVP